MSYLVYHVEKSNVVDCIFLITGVSIIDLYCYYMRRWLIF